MKESKKRFPKDAKLVFEGIKFNIYQWEQKMFDGTYATFERATHNPSVQIIATQGDKIVLLEEEQPFNGCFLSLIGGAVDSGENYEDAAKRELLEETGMKCDKLEFLEEAGETGHIYWDSIYYIARDCKIVQDPNLDSGEKIKIRLVSFEEFVGVIAEGNFRNKGFALKILRMYYKNSLDEFKKLLFN